MVDKDILNDVKNYLDITWEDSATDIKISGMISRAMNYFDTLTGTKLDYTVEDTPRELMLLRVMYERSGALDDFQKNYLSNINSLIKHERIKRKIAQEKPSN